jgi:hypothetical protein
LAEATTDMFVAGYDTGGGYQWLTHAGGTGAAEGFGVAVDGADQVFATGAFGGTLDLGSGPVVGAGLTDVYLLALSAAGAYRWSLGFGGPGPDRGIAVATDSGGNLALAGYFSQTVSFGGADLVSAGQEDLFVATFAPNAMPRWSRRLGDAKFNWAVAVDFDDADNAVVTGWFDDAADFGAGALPGAGGHDIFVAKYSPVGACYFARAFGGTGADIGQAVAARGGKTIVAGEFTGPVNIGAATHGGVGDQDVFVLALDP